MKRFFIAILCLAVCTGAADAKGKQKKPKKEPIYNEQGQIIKTGLNFGPLPAVAYDADKAFPLGAILNIYQYGVGST